MDTAAAKLTSLGLPLDLSPQAFGELRATPPALATPEVLRERMLEDGYRLSSDSRYQLASEPADERWIGAHPIAHGPAGKKGKIC